MKPLAARVVVASALIGAALSGAWAAVGTSNRADALDTWRGDYRLAVVASVLPVDKQTPARRFAQAFEALEDSTFLTAQWRYWQASRAREAWLDNAPGNPERADNGNGSRGAP